MNKTFEFLKHKTQVNFISTIDRDYFVRYTCTEKYNDTEFEYYEWAEKGNLDDLMGMEALEILKNLIEE